MNDSIYQNENDTAEDTPEVQTAETERQKLSEAEQALEEQSKEAERIQQERRRKRREAARREKEKQLRMRKTIKIALPCSAAVIAAAIFLTTGSVFGTGKADGQNEMTQESGMQQEMTEETADSEEAVVDTGAGAVAQDTESVTHISSRERYMSMLTDRTRDPGENVISSYAVLLNADTGEILAQREGMTRINPASMTKILTVLVAAEQMKKPEDLEAKVTITREITDYSYSNDCSAVGFAENETVSVRDLFYGTILPSGADAAAALAIHVAGSLDQFVELMNEKLEELGLSETSHMTNCVGLYDTEHYSTVYDMAMILKAAIDNEIAREALNAHVYTTASTPEHPDGITISNWFLRRIEDKETNGEVLYAKTGFVDQSGSCAASYELGDDQIGYLCVTANAYSSWRCIYDQVELYQMCVGEEASFNPEEEAQTAEQQSSAEMMDAETEGNADTPSEEAESDAEASSSET